jgi:outer membrane protein assembly factor BamB
MPAETNSSPIAVGDRVFTVAEPTRVLCLNANTGEILWQRELGYADSLSGKKATEARARAQKLKQDEAELGRLQSQLIVLIREARRAGATAETKRRRLDVMEHVTRLRRSVDSGKKFRTPPTNDIIGYSSATPVSDGASVFVVFANGLVASLSLDGAINWAKWFGDLPTGEMCGYPEGHAASPLLVGGRLILPFRNLMGLDPNTGEVVWTSGVYRNFGSPVSAAVGSVDVIVTPGGRIVRARDGRVLASGIDEVWHSGPLAHGRTLSYLGTGSESEMLRMGHATARSFALPRSASETIKTRSLWKQKLTKDLFFASPVFHRGILYAISRNMNLTAVRASNGRVLYERDISDEIFEDLNGGYQAYSSLAIAGGLLYASLSDGTTVVIKPGRKFKEIARNRLESTRSSLFFQGRRLYFRGSKNLYCVQEP